jgi:DNA-binding LacI/PurR family transcriptional regulator
MALRSALLDHMGEGFALGVDIPGQVALLGYDDFHLAEVVRSPITVIPQPIEELGHFAVELLFKRFLNDDESPMGGSSTRQPAQLTTQLVRRVSCGCEPTMRFNLNLIALDWTRIVIPKNNLCQSSPEDFI